MSRYDIAMDFKKKFISENENVSAKTLKPSFVSINGDDVKVSAYPYSMENAEHGLVIFHYTYTVITQTDRCIATLFFNSNGDIEDFIEIDGWKLYFDKPITSQYRCFGRYCHMTNGLLRLSIVTYTWKLDEEIERIWKLFSVVRTCVTQKEIDFVRKIYDRDEDLLSLKEKNLKAEAKIDALEMLLDAHKDLLEKIKELVNTNPL